MIVRVKDFGPGIQPEFISKLFQRFSRGDKTRKGTGLGLAITKKIVELHRGEITLAENKNGAVFEIKL